MSTALEKKLNKASPPKAPVAAGHCEHCKSPAGEPKSLREDVLLAAQAILALSPDEQKNVFKNVSGYIKLFQQFDKEQLYREALNDTVFLPQLSDDQIKHLTKPQDDERRLAVELADVRFSPSNCRRVLEPHLLKHLTKTQRGKYLYHLQHKMKRLIAINDRDHGGHIQP